MAKIVSIGLVLFFCFGIIAVAGIEVVTVTLNDDKLLNVFIELYQENGIGLTSSEQLILNNELVQMNREFKNKLYGSVILGNSEERGAVLGQIRDYLEAITSDEQLDISHEKVDYIQKHDMSLNKIVDELYS